MPVFVRGGDLISIQPMAWGEYEPEVVELIKHWADTNHSDFFHLASDVRPWPFLPRTINSIYNFIRGGHSVFLAPLTQMLPAGTCVLMIAPNDI